MIEFSNHTINRFHCLRCNSLSESVSKIDFLGVNAIATCFCTNCSKTFYHSLPLGHTIYFPVAFDNFGEKKFDEKARVWLAEPLIETFLKKKTVSGGIEKTIKARKDVAVILNCLDSCFGHIITKLLNSKTYLEGYPDLGLIVIIPKNCAFLVPNGVAEIWSIDVALKDMNQWINGFNIFFYEEIKRFKKTYLALGYMHMDYSKSPLSFLLGIERKSLDVFRDLPVQITFYFREDRIWTGNKLEEIVSLLSKQIKSLSFLNKILVYKQNLKINFLKRKISKEVKNANFCIVGIGRRRSLDKDIVDLRSHDFSPEVQREWWDLFSKSHIVIGIHGSSMIIPTALAMSFIDIVPRYKIFNYSDDISISHLTPNVLFFSRFVDVFSSTSLVAKHTIGIIRNFRLWNSEINVSHKIWQNPTSIYNSFDVKK